MNRLLLVSHGPLVGTGGGSARWRSLVRHLPDLGWEVDVVSAVPARSSDPYARSVDQGRRVDRRARLMLVVRRATGPIWRLLGMRAPPLSTLWIPRGAWVVRRRLRELRYDVVVATGPQMAALPAARIGSRGSGVPLVVELRDLWAGNPAYDSGGPFLAMIERWVLRRASAVVVTTSEAADSVRTRHPGIAECVYEVPNGFARELLDRRAAPRPRGNPLKVIHSGTLTPHRPIAPLLRVLAHEPYRSAVRVILHGYIAPEIWRELAEVRGCQVETVPPSSWQDAIERIAAADVALVTQAHGAGDATAIAAKLYEYLALGKPVLCITDGGATEGLLQRLGAAELCARLSDRNSITRALDQLLAGRLPRPLEPHRLLPYVHSEAARRMVNVVAQLRR